VIVLIGWGTLLLVGVVLQVGLDGDLIEIALQGGAGAAAIVVGVALAARARRPAPARGRAVPAGEANRSVAAGLAATGVALMAFGAEAGPWLVLIGAGTTLVGIASLMIEHRRERRR
jgi:hypothetical protein